MYTPMNYQCDACARINCHGDGCPGFVASREDREDAEERRAEWRMAREDV